MNDDDKPKDGFDQGVHAFVNNDLEGAVAHFSEVIDADPTFRLAHASRGAAFLRLERIADAIADFDRAIELDPSHARAYHLRGLAHERAGHPDQALADMNRAIEIDPDYGAAYLSRSAFYGRVGKESEAFEDIQAYTAISEEKLQTFANENNIWQSRQFQLEEAGVADPMNR